LENLVCETIKTRGKSAATITNFVGDAPRKKPGQMVVCGGVGGSAGSNALKSWKNYEMSEGGSFTIKK